MAPGEPTSLSSAPRQVKLCPHSASCPDNFNQEHLGLKYLVRNIKTVLDWG